MKLPTAVAVIIAVLAGLALMPAGVLALPTTANPLAAQQKAVADAKVKLDQARMVLVLLRKKVEIGFEAKPEWKAVKDTMEKAKVDYDSAGRKIVAALANVPAYKEQVAKRDKAAAITDAAQNKPVSASSSDDDSAKVTSEDLANAQRDRTLAVLEMKRQEKEAQDNDANYVALKQKWVDAESAWSAIEMQVDDAVKLDPGYLPAQQAIDQAEAAYKQARDAFAAAAKAHRDAEEAQIKAKSKSGRR